MPKSVWEGMKDSQRSFLQTGDIPPWQQTLGGVSLEAPTKGGFPNVVALFKEIPEDKEHAHRTAAADKLENAMNNEKGPDVGFMRNLNATLDPKTRQSIAEALRDNPAAMNKQMGDMIGKIRAGDHAGVDKLLNDVNRPAAAASPPAPQQTVNVQAPSSQKEITNAPDTAINPRFKDPLGVSGTGLAVEPMIDENNEIFDSSIFENKFLNEVRAGKTGAAAMGGNSQSAGDSTNSGSSGNNSKSDVVNSSVTVEAGNTQGNGIPAEIANAPGFNDFMDNLVLPEAEGGLGLGQELTDLLEGSSGAAGGSGFIDSLKDQLKDNPKLFEEMNGVIDDADSSQRAGLREHFQTVFAASGKGGDAMDMALADLQGYAGGVAMANSPMGGMLGGLIEKFLPGIMKMMDGFLGSLGIEGGASGLLSSLGFGDSFMAGLTSKGADGGQNLTESQQQVLDGAEKFFETNGQEIDGFMAGLDNNQAALLAATLDPKADGTIAERAQEFEDSLSGLQKGTWEKWKGEGREIIAQDPELANSEFAKLLDASDALPPSEPAITAAEFGEGLTAEQATNLAHTVHPGGNQEVFNDNYQKFWDSLSPKQQQGWVDLVGEEPNFGEIAQAGQDAIAGRNDKIFSGQQEKQEHKGQGQEQGQENNRGHQPKDESELDKDRGTGNDGRHEQIAAYEQDFKNFTAKGDLHGASGGPEGEGEFSIAADMGAKGPVKLANGDIVSIGGKDRGDTPEISKPENDPNNPANKGYNPAAMA